MSLFGDMEDDRTPELVEAEDIEVAVHKSPCKKKAIYDEMFGSLPVRQVKLDNLKLEELICANCGDKMVAIGTEVVFHPATLERIEYIATTYECPSCKLTENPYFIKDNDAKTLVPHSYVSASLATYVMYSKFINAMPYHRHEKDFTNPAVQGILYVGLCSAYKKQRTIHIGYPFIRYSNEHVNDFYLRKKTNDKLIM